MCAATHVCGTRHKHSSVFQAVTPAHNCVPTSNAVLPVLVFQTEEPSSCIIILSSGAMGKCP